MKKRRVILKVIIIAISLLMAGSLIYLLTGNYSATNNATTSFDSYFVDNNTYYEYSNSENDNTGFIFYPGAKVDPKAYSYLKDINANVFIAKFPFNIAFFRSNVASDIIEQNKTINNWYIGGHSLGGTVAFEYAKDNSDLFNGCIFLGSYTIDDESSSNIKTLAFFATNDGLIDNYKEKIKLLPTNANVVEINGGNHSNYGDYGFQKKDNKATISQKEQQDIIINNINKFIQTNND